MECLHLITALNASRKTFAGCRICCITLESPLVFAHAKTVESIIASEHWFQDGKQQTNNNTLREGHSEKWRWITFKITAHNMRCSGLTGWEDMPAPPRYSMSTCALLHVPLWLICKWTNEPLVSRGPEFPCLVCIAGFTPAQMKRTIKGNKCCIIVAFIDYLCTMYAGL